jgi:hypothetical protein
MLAKSGWQIPRQREVPWPSIFSVRLPANTAKLVDLWPTLVPTAAIDGDARHIEAVASEFAAELQR